MADINNVVLVGRLTRDAELKYTASGQVFCKLALAINRRRKVGEKWEDEVNYFDVVSWGRQGEALNQYLLKGKQVGIEGELRQDRWQQDGQNRSKIEIVANNIQLLGGGGQSASAFSSGGGSAQNERSESGPSSSDASGRDEFTDDIPF